MGKIIKKCLACGTLNQYDAQACKSCECVLLADVDQDDEILAIDPMEAALDDAVAEADEDDVVAQILREQAENAKKIVAKEKAKEERKKKQQMENASPFSTAGLSGTGRGFSIGGGSSDSGAGSSSGNGGGFGTFGRVESGAGSGFGFKISEGGSSEDVAAGKAKVNGSSFRMQAIRQAQKDKNN